MLRKNETSKGTENAVKCTIDIQIRLLHII